MLVTILVSSFVKEVPLGPLRHWVPGTTASLALNGMFYILTLDVQQKYKMSSKVTRVHNKKNLNNNKRHIDALFTPNYVDSHLRFP